MTNAETESIAIPAQSERQAMDWSLVLASQDNVVLGVVLWRLFEDGHAAEASAVASIVMAVVAPLLFVGRRLLVRRNAAP